MFGSHTKSFHPGRAGQSGLVAAILAQGGYTSSEQALEAKRGWANVVGVTKPNIQEDLDKWLGMSDLEKSEKAVGLVSGEGKGRWETMRNSFKPFPCGIVIHPIIDACAQIHVDMTNSKLNVKDIKSIFARVHPLVLELTGKRKPKDGLEGKFSVFHGAAIGLIFGKGTPSQYEDSVVKDAEVISIRDKVDAEADPKLGADEAIITVTMNDGKVLEKHVLHSVGSLEVPMNDEMLQKKFKDQCAGVLGEKVEAASDACWKIEELKDVAELSKYL